MSLRSQRGFTLLEIMLVLLILVLVTALAVPTLSGALDGFRLKKSTDIVRAAWARTRNDAMETGRIYVFRYEINGSRYWSEPWFAADDTTADPDEFQSVAPSPGRFLPDTITFADGQTQSTARSIEVEDDVPNSPSLNEKSLGRPIIFYPDGTTSTARLFLKNDSDGMIAIDLRGLTGIASVSDVLVDDSTQQ